MQTKITRKLTIEDLEKISIEAKDKVNQAFTLLHEAELLLKELDEKNYLSIDRMFNLESNKDSECKKVTNTINSKMWDYLINSLNFRECMTSKERANFEFDNRPEFTAKTAQATYESMKKERGNLLTKLAQSCFSGRSRVHKSTNNMMISNKVIYNNCYESRNTYFSVSRYGCDSLNDTFRLLKIVTGSNEHYTAYDFASVGEHEIFNGNVVIKVFKNGNVHLLIKDKDLLFNINYILAGGNASNLGY